MKMKLAALAALLMAGAAPAALAQDQGDHHQGQSGGERPGGAPGHAAEARAWHGPAMAPHAPPAAPQARQAPVAPTPRAAPGHWGGRPDGGALRGGWAGPNGFHGRGAPPAEPARPQPGAGGRNFVRRPGTWVDNEGDQARSPADRADAQDQREARDWRRFNGGQFDPGAGQPPRVESWGRDHPGDRRDHGDRRDNGDHGDHGDRHWNGDHGDHGGAGHWNGDRGDHGDRGHWNGDHRHPNPPPGNHPRWSPGRYPHSYGAHHRYHVRPYRQPPGFFFQVWNYGDFLPPAWYSPDYLIEDWWDYDLPQPPYGYDWVRVGDDALLVDEYDGRVVQVVRDLFW